METILVVDIQGDFTEWKKGSLAVPGTGEDYVQEVLQITRRFKEAGHPVLATQDWHPADHISFHTSHPGKKPFAAVSLEGREQILWPPHCVQHTAGAALLIDPSLFDAVVHKGTDRRYDSYSGFEDDGGVWTGLDQELEKRNTTRIILYGIATDYCVRFTALHGLGRGYAVTVIESLCRGVAPETSTRAWEEMKSAGAVIVRDAGDTRLFS
ncbi:MAG: bifunctional nicotinamidase/pyrazinamidase [Deltaproteobacteria bacterium]|nr:bifunctional nicotinamidase/pyrazinamidase [Deltaproteobacteria bacterium]